MTGDSYPAGGTLLISFSPLRFNNTNPMFWRWKKHILEKKKSIAAPPLSLERITNLLGFGYPANQDESNYPQTESFELR